MLCSFCFAPCWTMNDLGGCARRRSGKNIGGEPVDSGAETSVAAEVEVLTQEQRAAFAGDAWTDDEMRHVGRQAARIRGDFHDDVVEFYDSDPLSPDQRAMIKLRWPGLLASFDQVRTGQPASGLEDVTARLLGEFDAVEARIGTAIARDNVGGRISARDREIFDRWCPMCADCLTNENEKMHEQLRAVAVKCTPAERAELKRRFPGLSLSTSPTIADDAAISPTPEESAPVEASGVEASGGAPKSDSGTTRKDCEPGPVGGGHVTRVFVDPEFTLTEFAQTKGCAPAMTGRNLYYAAAAEEPQTRQEVSSDGREAAADDGALAPVALELERIGRDIEQARRHLDALHASVSVQAGLSRLCDELVAFANMLAPSTVDAPWVGGGGGL